MPSFVDTNILLYFFATRPAEAEKRKTATSILKRTDLVVSVQVLQEFYVQATRQTREDRMSTADARHFIFSLKRFPIQAQSIELFELALDITDRFKFSYWDSAILAAARLTGCDTLFTEDLRHEQVIDGLKIVNPFRVE